MLVSLVDAERKAEVIEIVVKRKRRTETKENKGEGMGRKTETKTKERNETDNQGDNINRVRLCMYIPYSWTDVILTAKRENI